MTELNKWLSKISNIFMAKLNDNVLKYIIFQNNRGEVPIPIFGGEEEWNVVRTLLDHLLGVCANP